jgi:thiamine transport system substrate-binding protein
MHKSLLLILALALALTGCAKPTPAATPTPSGPRTLTVMTHSSFAASESAIAAFEAQYNAKLVFLKAGDAGTALNKAILSKGNPLADVFYGIDNTFLSRALDEGIFEPYASPRLAEIPAEFKLDPQNRALPVDYGDVCLNYDRTYFDERQLTPPQTLEDLLKPEYRGLLVVEDAATSSPGLAFLLTTIVHFGDPGYLTFWQGLVENEVKVVSDWNSAYYTEFTRSGGTRPLVVSYNSSPAFEVLYADTPVSTPPTAAIVGPGTCYRQIEFVGILQGTPNRDLAAAWVDYMLGATFQEDLPLQMWVFPVLPTAKLDEVFTQQLAPAQAPAALDPAQIAAQRETWLQAWSELALR